MITFIISSVFPERQAQVVENIISACGCEPEIFVHDNREACWGLCRVYNHYSAMASNEVICYLHEDIFFRTDNWGEKIVSFYRDNPDAGVVGFLGSQLKTKSPSAVGGNKKYEMGSLIQHSGSNRIKSYMQRSGSGDFSRVVQIDGLCMFVRKSVWEKYPFDEASFDRFHLYDLDFTINIARHYKNYVCHSVVAEHMSEGSHNDEWYHYTKVFQEKWGAKLPMSCIPLSPRQIRRAEEYAAYKFYKNVLKNHRTAHIDFAREMYLPYRTLLSDLRLFRYK